MENTYLIHDNGGRPFKVEITKNDNYSCVQIYKTTKNWNCNYETIPILTFETDKIFIGESPLIKMTEFSGGHGTKFDGNSILLHLCGNTYVFIGLEIFSFSTYGKIISYVSPVGNSDVPYPYALDEHGNIYLLTEDVVIKNNADVLRNMDAYDDPYDYYYDYYLITADRGCIPRIQPPINFFNGIKEYYIGDDRYTLTYEPFPEKDYDRLISSLGTSMHVIDTNDNIITLNKESYSELMKSFGLLQSFEPIMDKNILQKRL